MAFLYSFIHSSRESAVSYTEKRLNPNLLSRNLKDSREGEACPRVTIALDRKSHMHAKSLQLCPTFCNIMDCNPPRLLSMRFSRLKYWSGLPFPTPRQEVMFPYTQIQPYQLFKHLNTPILMGYDYSPGLAGIPLAPQILARDPLPVTCHSPADNGRMLVPTRSSRSTLAVGPWPR